MYTGLLHTHRLFAYLFLVAAVAAVAMAKHGWLLKRTQQNAWDRRTALFALLEVTGAQVWMTGTEPELFHGIGSSAELLAIGQS